MLHILLRLGWGGGGGGGTASLQLNKEDPKIDTTKACENFKACGNFKAFLAIVFIMSISVIKLSAYALKLH